MDPRIPFFHPSFQWLVGAYCVHARSSQIEGNCFSPPTPYNSVLLALPLPFFPVHTLLHYLSRTKTPVIMTGGICALRGCVCVCAPRASLGCFAHRKTLHIPLQDCFRGGGCCRLLHAAVTLPPPHPKDCMLFFLYRSEGQFKGERTV